MIVKAVVRWMALINFSIAVGICVGPVSASPVWANHSGVSSMSIREKFDLHTPGAAVAVAWSSDSSTLAAASSYGGVLTVWDGNGRLVNQFKRTGDGPALGGSLAFVEGASQLVFYPPGGADKSMAFAVWEVATGRVIRTEYGPQPGEDYPLNRAQHFMTSSNQTLLAVATGGNRGSTHFEKNVVIYDTRTWRLLHTLKVLDGISSLCVFAGGSSVGLGAMGSGRIAVIDAVSGKSINEFTAYTESKYGTVSVGAVAGSPAGDLIMVGVGGIYPSGEYAQSAEQRVWEKSIDPVRMFRAQDGSRIASFTAAKGPIRQAIWDPKGRFVAFVDNARGLFIWAPWRGDGYTKIELPSQTLSIAVAPDGSRIAATTADGVRVFSID
jgi:hypothetical protein